MINEQKFNKEIKEYDNYLDKIIVRKGFDDFKGVHLEFMLSRLIKQKYDTDIKGRTLNEAYIQELFKQDDYRGIHEELQKVFLEFIPFVLIRRFLIKVERLGVDNVCKLVNKYKEYYNYNDTIDWVQINKC